MLEDLFWFEFCYCDDLWAEYNSYIMQNMVNHEKKWGMVQCLRACYVNMRTSVQIPRTHISAGSLISWLSLIRWRQDSPRIRWPCLIALRGSMWEGNSQNRLWTSRRTHTHTYTSPQTCVYHTCKHAYKHPYHTYTYIHIQKMEK